MTGMREDLERHLTHRQPRDRRVDLEPATGVNAGTPSDRDGADDAPDEAKGVSSPAPVAVNCPNDHGPDGVIACWSPGGPCAVLDDPACETCGPCFNCTDRHPLTPADPHDHDWADLGTPGLHGSVCRACGETQID